MSKEHKFILQKISCRWGIQKWGYQIPGNFQNKLVCSSFKWMSMYVLFLAKLKIGGRSSLERSKWIGAKDEITSKNT